MMAMFDFDRPLYTRQDMNKLGIDKDKFYYVSFFNAGKLDTRPIKISAVFTVSSNQAGSAYLRTEAQWVYHFETEKSISKRLIDPNFWGRMFDKYKIIRKPITEKWKIEFTEDWDTLNYYLIGETPDEAKLRLIMTGLNTHHPDNNDRIKILQKEFENFNETNPDLVIKAMDYRLDNQYGNIPDYSKHFLTIKDDIRNK